MLRIMVIALRSCSSFNILGWRRRSFWSVYPSLFCEVYFCEPLWSCKKVLITGKVELIQGQLTQTEMWSILFSRYFLICIKTQLWWKSLLMCTSSYKSLTQESSWSITWVLCKADFSPPHAEGLSGFGTDLTVLDQWCPDAGASGWNAQVFGREYCG